MRGSQSVFLFLNTALLLGPFPPALLLLRWQAAVQPLNHTTTSSSSLCMLVLHRQLALRLELPMTSPGTSIWTRFELPKKTICGLTPSSEQGSFAETANQQRERHRSWGGGCMTFSLSRPLSIWSLDVLLMWMGKWGRPPPAPPLSLPRLFSSCLSMLPG